MLLSRGSARLWLGSLNISKSSVSKIYQKRAYFPFLLKNKVEDLDFYRYELNLSSSSSPTLVNSIIQNVFFWHPI